MSLEDLKVYERSMILGEQVWALVNKWEYFEKQTLGRQWARAADSVAANLSEGYGRYHYKDSRNFAYYARGSLYETKTWLRKAFSRNLLSNESADELMVSIEVLLRMLNSYINSIGDTGNTLGPNSNH